MSIPTKQFAWTPEPPQNKHPQIEITWSREAIVEVLGEGVVNLFQEATIAAVGKWPNGNTKVLVWPRGWLLHNERPSDDEARALLLRQAEPVARLSL